MIPRTSNGGTSPMKAAAATVPEDQDEPGPVRREVKLKIRQRFPLPRAVSDLIGAILP